MNRFFRSALFPLIVIVLLVYLASQTLMHQEKREKVTYSQLQSQVRSGEPKIQEIVINPNNQEMTVQYEPANGSDKGEKTKVAYPSPESLNGFEKLMTQKGVEFD